MRYCGVLLALSTCLVLPDCVESYTRRSEHISMKIGETLSLKLNNETLFRPGEWTGDMENTIRAMYLDYTCAGCPSFMKVASRQKKDDWKLRVEDEHSKFIVSRSYEKWVLVTKINMQIFHSGVFKVRIEFKEPHEAMEFLTLVMVEGPEATKKSEYEGPLLFAIQLATTIQIIGLFVQSYRFVRWLFARQDAEEREFVEGVVHGRRFF